MPKENFKKFTKNSHLEKSPKKNPSTGHRKGRKNGFIYAQTIITYM